MEPKITKDEEIYTVCEYDTNRKTHLFSYQHWDKRSFAIACNQKYLDNRVCYVSDVICGWLIKHEPDNISSFDMEYRFFPSKPLGKSQPITYFQL